MAKCNEIIDYGNDDNNYYSDQSITSKADIMINVAMHSTHKPCIYEVYVYLHRCNMHVNTRGSYTTLQLAS